MSKTKQVTLRLNDEQSGALASFAKHAGVSPKAALRVILAIEARKAMDGFYKEEIVKRNNTLARAAEMMRSKVSVRHKDRVVLLSVIDDLVKVKV